MRAISLAVWQVLSACLAPCAIDALPVSMAADDAYQEVPGVPLTDSQDPPPPPPPPPPPGKSRKAARPVATHRVAAERQYQAPNGIYSLELDADGKRVLSTSGDETAVRMRATADGGELRSLDTGEFTDCRRFSPDGRRIFISDWKPQVVVYDGADYSRLTALPFPVRVTGIAVHPAGDEVAFGRFDGVIDVYSTSTWKMSRSVAAHHYYVSGLDYSRDGSLLVSGILEGTVKLWSTADGYALRREVTREKERATPSLLPGEDRILVLSDPRKIAVLDPTTGTTVWSASLPTDVHEASADPGGALMAAATDAKMVFVWDWKRGGAPLVFQAHGDQVLAAVFHPDGRTLFTAGLDRVWKAWSVERLKALLSGGGKR